MKNFGIVSCNIYCNFTNYGSALQSWALSESIKKLGYSAKLVDYCPDIMADKDPLNPFKNMWDKDVESRRMCELTMPAIRENYLKFDTFYNKRFDKTLKKYTSANFDQIVSEVDGFVCGSDTIFCPDEFGFDDGYYANYECMKKGYAVAYAASFGDPHFTDESYSVLNDRLKNFKAIGLRENLMLQHVKEHVNIPVQKVIDPTLLLASEDYDAIAEERQIKEKYLLLYTRRYNPEMEKYAEKLAAQNGWKLVEISLRATNAEKGHIMRYDAGVEEFVSLVKYSEYVVTNSFHGTIFAVQYKKPFLVFLREQGNTKINELLELFGLHNRLYVFQNECIKDIDYGFVHRNIDVAKRDSINFLSMELSGLK